MKSVFHINCTYILTVVHLHMKSVFHINYSYILIVVHLHMKSVFHINCTYILTVVHLHMKSVFHINCTYILTAVHLHMKSVFHINCTYLTSPLFCDLVRYFPFRILLGIVLPFGATWTRTKLKMERKDWQITRASWHPTGKHLSRKYVSGWKPITSQIG